MSISLLKIISDFDTQLATAASVGATTATLVSATDDDGVALPTGTYGLTIDAGNSSKEYIICTLTSTALTSIVNVTRQGVTSSGFARTHRRGAKVTLTDWAILKRILNNLDGTTGFNSSVPLFYDGNPTFTLGAEIITKKYADDLAIAGSPNMDLTTKGIAEEATAAEINAGTQTGGTSAELAVNPKYLKDSIYYTQLPSSGQKAALAGTSGTPASGNKYVTNDDTSATTAASKVYRMTAGGKLDATLLDGNLPAISGSSLTGVSYGIFKNGSTTRDLSTASGNQTIAHGLGVAPKKIKITVIQGASTSFNISIGTYNGTTNSNVYHGTNSNSQYYAGGGDTNVISIYTNATTDTSPSTATATYDATNITLAWTKAAGASGTAYILWEAEA